MLWCLSVVSDILVKPSSVVIVLDLSWIYAPISTIEVNENPTAYIHCSVRERYTSSNAEMKLRTREISWTRGSYLYLIGWVGIDNWVPSCANRAGRNQNIIRLEMIENSIGQLNGYCWQRGCSLVRHSFWWIFVLCAFYDLKRWRLCGFISYESNHAWGFFLLRHACAITASSGK